MYVAVCSDLDRGDGRANQLVRLWIVDLLKRAAEFRLQVSGVMDDPHDIHLIPIQRVENHITLFPNAPDLQV